MNETAHPLSWPQNQPRTPPQKRIASAPFTVGENYEKEVSDWNNGQRTTRKVKAHRSREVSIAIATERLEDQLRFLDAKHPILSTNLELRLNGMPRSGQADPADPGAAIYFTLKGKRTVLACDKWKRTADNIAALAAHIRAIRSVENYGVGTLEQAFRGYQALEDFSSSTIPWRRVLGFKETDPVTRDLAESRYREHIKRVHPDMTGEAHLQAAQLNLAIAQARAELGEERASA